MYAAYGTYERITYPTVTLPAWVSWASGALLLRMVGWAVLLAAGVVVGLGVFAAVYWLAAALLVYAGQIVLCGGVLAAFAVVTYPRR